MSDDRVDLSVPRTYFEPNPRKWRYGAEVPIPAAVKKVADELDGKILPLFEAIKKIETATQGRGEVVVTEDSIMLWSVPRAMIDTFPGAIHSWRVIRYR